MDGQQDYTFASVQILDPDFQKSFFSFQRNPCNPFILPPTHSFLHSSLHLPIHPSIHPSTHPFIPPSIRPPIHPSIHPSIPPSTHSSLHPSIHPSTHPFIPPPTHSFLYPPIQPPTQQHLLKLSHLLECSRLPPPVSRKKREVVCPGSGGKACSGRVTGVPSPFLLQACHPLLEGTGEGRQERKYQWSEEEERV